MAAITPCVFDHRGRHYRLERPTGSHWRVFEGKILIDAIPANLEEECNTELVALAKEVINSHLDGKTPHGP
jgi:hypothetical protein